MRQTNNWCQSRPERYLIHWRFSPELTCVICLKLGHQCYRKGCDRCSRATPKQKSSTPSSKPPDSTSYQFYSQCKPPEPRCRWKWRWRWRWEWGWGCKEKTSPSPSKGAPSWVAFILSNELEECTEPGETVLAISCCHRKRLSGTWPTFEPGSKYSQEEHWWLYSRGWNFRRRSVLLTTACVPFWIFHNRIQTRPQYEHPCTSLNSFTDDAYYSWTRSSKRLQPGVAEWRIWQKISSSNRRHMVLHYSLR